MTARANNYVFAGEEDENEIYKDLPEDYDDFDLELEEDDLIISSDLVKRQQKFKKLSIINACILAGWLAFLVLSLRLLLPTFGFYTITGRYFVAFPFFLELFLNAGFAFLGFVFLRHRMSGHVLAVIYLFINCIYNVIIFWYFPRELKSFFYEPNGQVNEDWQWMWTLLQTYFVFSVISIVLQFVLAFTIVYRLRKSPVVAIYANDDKIDSKSRTISAVHVGISLWVAVSFALFAISLISAVAVLPQWSPPEVNLALPWPSNEFTTKDQSTITGLRLDIPTDRLPPSKGSGSWDTQYWRELDGFSVMSPLLVKFNDLSSQGLTPWNDTESYQHSDAVTVIVNTKTGEKIPHWAEVDANEPIDPLLIIHVAVPLDWATRYVVGIRRLVSKSGSVIEASGSFKKLRDDDQDKSTEWRYFDEDIFPFLANAGFVRTELQLAWDFTTMSREICLGRAETIRDDALNRIGDVTYKINLVEEDSCEGVSNETMARTIHGEINAPYYLASPSRGSFLPRVDGARVTKLTPTGTKTAKFLIRIPCSLKLSAKPADMILQYGHGLFGSRSEGMTRHLRRISNSYNYVLVAMDWYGMSKHDVPIVARWLMSEMSNFASLPEMTLQGFVFKSVMLRVMKGALAKDPAMNFGDVAVVSNDTPVGYYGNSQGGIIGGAYVASSRDIKRGVLGVMGSPYALLLPRSVDFTRYQRLLSYQFYGWTHQLFIIHLMQPLWDQGESAGWLSSMVFNPQPGMPSKQILLHMAFGDAQVSYLGAEVMARSYNASNIGPVVRPIFGVPEQNGPFYGSAIAQWRYESVPWEPFNNTAPPKKFDTHECPRREYEAQSQIRDFLKEGVIRQYCNGPCIREQCPEKY